MFKLFKVTWRHTTYQDIRELSEIVPTGRWKIITTDSESTLFIESKVFWVKYWIDEKDLEIHFYNEYISECTIK